MGKPAVQLLGGFDLIAPGDAAGQKLGKKAQALLAYLAMNNGKAFTREHLAALLWPDRQDEQARQSLRQATASLRKALGPEAAYILVTDGDGLRTDPARLDVDAPAYLNRLKSGSRDDAVAALAAFPGDLLDQFGTVSDEFDAWCDRERHEVRLRTAEALDRLTMADDPWLGREEAAALARTLIERDSLCESGHRALIRHYGRTGQTSLAHRQFRICKATLKQELDIEPEHDTLAVLHAVASGPSPKVEDGSGRPAAGPATSTGLRRRPWLRLAAIGSGLAALIVLMALTGILPIGSGPQEAGAPGAPSPALAIDPGAKSIAILPFRVIGDDQRADDFVIGLTEGLATATAMASDLTVISSGTTLTYRDSRLTPREIAVELNVEYVLEGSVQLADGQARVMASLLDMKTGGTAWSQLYERRATDILLVQREIIRALLKELQVELTEGEQARIPAISETSNLEAWLLASKALQAMRQLSPSDLNRARLLYRQALALDPDYSEAKNGLAWTHVVELIIGPDVSPPESLAVIEETASYVLEHDPGQPAGHSLRAFTELMRGRHDEAKRYGQKSITLMPGFADFRALYGLILTYTGDYDQASDLIRSAMKLSPARHDWYLWTLGRAHRFAGRPEESLKLLNAAGDGACSSPIHCLEQAATLAALNRVDEAKAKARQVLASYPNFSVERYLAAPPHRDPAVTEREARLLIRAGLPK